MPKLSIIIPTFNSTATIERCLRSISVQTFTDYEIIVQDGSPNDETARAIENFLAEHQSMLIRIRHEPDRGVYDAMNKAMAKAQGEWLYFLGSDDELCDDKVLATIMTARNTANCNVLYGNVRVIGDACGVTSGSLYGGPFSLPKLLNRNICHQALFYRASFARKIGDYNTAYPLWADWDLNLHCWAEAEFRYLDISIANFYAGGLSSTRPADERFAAEVARNLVDYFGFSLLQSPLELSGIRWPRWGLEATVGKGKLLGYLWKDREGTDTLHRLDAQGRLIHLLSTSLRNHEPTDRRNTFVQPIQRRPGSAQAHLPSNWQ